MSNKIDIDSYPPLVHVLLLVSCWYAIVSVYRQEFAFLLQEAAPVEVETVEETPSKDIDAYETDQEDISLTDEEIKGMNKCGKDYFVLKENGKYEYKKIRNGKKHWAALSYIYLKIHGNNLDNHATRLRKYWNYPDLFKKMDDDTKTDIGLKRCQRWRDPIDNIFAS